MAIFKAIRTVLAGVIMVASVVGCASTPTRESAGEYVDDSTITGKVKGAIFEDPSLKSMQINVETYRGVVQLSGFVDSEQSAAKAGEVAKSVKGVKSVQNSLVVKPPR